MPGLNTDRGVPRHRRARSVAWSDEASCGTADTTGGGAIDTSGTPAIWRVSAAGVSGGKAAGNGTRITTIGTAEGGIHTGNRPSALVVGPCQIHRRRSSHIFTPWVSNT
jgi:hypothetical protein